MHTATAAGGFKVGTACGSTDGGPRVLQTILPQQGFLEEEGHRQGILKYLPPDTADAVQRAWDGMRGRPGEDDINVQRWHRLVQQCAKVRHHP